MTPEAETQSVMPQSWEPQTNAPNLRYALDFLKRVISIRCKLHFAAADASEVVPPRLAYFQDDSAFSRFIDERKPTFDEYVILLLALAPHVAPGLIDGWIQAALPESGDFPVFGGTRDNEKRAFFPTGETAAFLLAGDDLDDRFRVQHVLSGEHWFARDGVLRLEPAREGEPFLSGRLLLDPEFIELFTVGEISTPAFSAVFPAREIVTDLEWSDLILSSGTLEQIEELRDWIRYNDVLLDEWKMRKRIRQGYRALFYGPPGTGKTLTATLLGKYTQHKVFRIDLSTIVSKYVGETEKNLANLFDKARGQRRPTTAPSEGSGAKPWILFFDEADALFGKRTSVKDAHDRFANQEISYLLQRIEEFDGLVVLASNFKANMDEAFLRRFNAIIKFPFPAEAEREAIWRTSLPANVHTEGGADLATSLARFELTGGNIVNVVHHACLRAIARGSESITLDDALIGIRREFDKEGKVFKNVLDA